MRDHRPDLLSVDRLRSRSATVPDQAGDALNGDACVGKLNETKLCRSSRGVHSPGVNPAAATTFRNERRTCEAPAGVSVERITRQTDEISRLGISTGTPVAEHIRTGYTAIGKSVRVMISVVPGDTLILQYTIPT